MAHVHATDWGTGASPLPHGSPPPGGSRGASLVAVLSMSLMLACLLRYGLLATFALSLSLRLFENTPLAPTSDAWYAPYGHATLALTIVLLVWVAWPLLRANNDLRTRGEVDGEGAQAAG